MSSRLIDMRSTELRNKLISNTVKYSNDFYNIPILNIHVRELEHGTRTRVVDVPRPNSPRNHVNCVYTFKFIRIDDSGKLPCLEYGSFHGSELIKKYDVYFRIYEVNEDYFLYEFTGNFLYEPYYKRIPHNHMFNDLFYRTATIL